MSESIKSDEKDLKLLISELFQISCIEIPSFFMEEKQHIDIKEVISKFEKFKNEIQNKINQEIFTFKNDYFEAISPDQFLQKFKENRLVFFCKFLFFLNKYQKNNKNFN